MNYIQGELQRQALVFAVLLGAVDAKARISNQYSPFEREQSGANDAEAAGRNMRPADQESAKNDVSHGRIDLKSLLLQAQSNQDLFQAASALMLSLSGIGMLEVPAAESSGKKWSQVSTDAPNLEPARIQVTDSPRDLSRTDSIRRDTYAENKETSQEDEKVYESSALFAVNWKQPARELSRVFQRDARRYDGGYPLY